MWNAVFIWSQKCTHLLKRSSKMWTHFWRKEKIMERQNFCKAKVEVEKSFRRCRNLLTKKAIVCLTCAFNSFWKQVSKFHLMLVFSFLRPNENRIVMLTNCFKLNNFYISVFTFVKVPLSFSRIKYLSKVASSPSGWFSVVEKEKSLSGIYLIYCYT